MKDDGLSGKQKVLFHKNCRGNYNLQCVKRKQEALHTLQRKSEEAPLVSRRLSRASTSSFNIREKCFICGEGDKKTNKLTPVSKETSKATRFKVLAASEERLDEEVKLQMLSYPDLFAFDAKYHHNCYSHYIYERNIKAAGKKARSESDFSVYDTALKTLTTELSNSIFSSQKTVMFLTDLNETFIQIL